MVNAVAVSEAGREAMDSKIPPSVRRFGTEFSDSSDESSEAGSDGIGFGISEERFDSRIAFI